MKDTRDPLDEDPAAATPGTKDRDLCKLIASMTMGTSPVFALSMINDWALHMATAPDKQLDLAHKATRHWIKWQHFVAKGCPPDPTDRPIAADRRDRRFSHDAWNKAPYAALSQAFLLLEDLVDTATSDVPGLNSAHDRAMSFMARQWLDALAPSNFLATNPEAIAHTYESKGRNLLKGSTALLRDAQALSRGEASRPALEVGRDVAATPGKVVFRNHLMELIQYAPVTEQVQAEPVLIVPAWIMKYYILDLRPENSMIRYLTERGFTVFAISWRNPGAEDANLGMLDYLRQGPMAAITHICRGKPQQQVHGVGYCLGGTLLSIAAASMARDGDDRLASLSPLAAQTDFMDAGELMLFINESRVSFLEDTMAEKGYLDSGQMSATFHMLRSNDLVWSQMVRSYLLGEDEPAQNDLMSWNLDSMRMPARMHSEYLRHMLLNNDLSAGRYEVDGHPVSLRDIRIPVFAVGTEADHIAPWRSVFKIHNLGHANVTFALTNGGHNAGILSEPGHEKRHFRLHTIRDADAALSPEKWLDTAELKEGSWWTEWARWLTDMSSGLKSPPKMAGPLEDAPGSYVRMK